MSHTTAGNGHFIAIDWGTSSFRAWRMQADGQVVASSRSDEGMLHCASAGFEPVMRKHLQQLEATADDPVLICGMAGARQGWKEAPYLHTPTRLGHLHEGAVRLDVAGDVRILPGVAHADADAPDVMRGEETQILGSVADDFTGLVCIPGTHSKWIALQGGRLESFTTYLTGELFAVLGKHSILAYALEQGSTTAPDDAAFAAGLTTGAADLQRHLFGLRASQLLGFADKAAGAATLSGMLIGAELASAARVYGSDVPVMLIASGALGKLYEKALAQAGFTVQLADAETASQRGLCKAAQALWRSQ